VLAGLGARGAQVIDVTDALGASRAELAAALAEAAGPGGAAGVIWLASRAGGPALAAGLARLIQALADTGLDARLWCLTHGAGPAGGGAHPPDPAAWQLWGLGRVAALEYPRMWGGSVDLPRVADEAALDRLAAVLAGDGSEDQVAVRAGAVLVPRLARLPVRTGPGWRPRGTIVITGASGALGGHLARWLARRGAERIVLASRRGGQAPGTAELASDLAGAGAETVFQACDTGDRGQVLALIAAADRDGTLTAVFHLAGTRLPTPLDSTGPDDIARLLEAKAAGASYLDEAVGDRPLSAFVLFSSVAGIWGGGGQGAYAAANAFLDGLAAARRARGLAATAVAWGPWHGEGMAAGQEGRYLARRGLRALAPRLALAALGQALDEDLAAVTIADVDWAVFAPAFTTARPRPMLAAIPEAAAALTADSVPGTAARVAATGSLAARLARLGTVGQQQLMLEMVQAEAAAVLGHSAADDVEAGRAFKDLGVDSVTAVELRDRLSVASGLRLPASLLYDYPSAAAVAEHLRMELSPDGGSEEARVREALASLPLSRLREAGLLDALLQVAGGGPAPHAQAQAQAIDTLDTDSLIRMALGDR
jgi:NAD(P)-dependent dehydrogenase (short-subunit alcohol dehydrogenase family)/acyl carrier protein